MIEYIFEIHSCSTIYMITLIMYITEIRLEVYVQSIAFNLLTREDIVLEDLWVLFMLSDLGTSENMKNDPNETEDDHNECDDANSESAVNFSFSRHVNLFCAKIFKHMFQNGDILKLFLNESYDNVYL